MTASTSARRARRSSARASPISRLAIRTWTWPGFPPPGGRQIVISFRNVRGGLTSAGRPTGFSLRHPDGREYVAIFKTTIAGDDVVLHIENATLPEGVSLFYGYGVDPYCNVTDAADAPVPAFGPIKIAP